MFSLEKASRVTENRWTSNALSRTHPRTITQIAFRDPPIGPEDSGDTTPDEVALGDLSDRQIGGRSDEGMFDNRHRTGLELWLGEMRSGSEPATTVMTRLEA